MKVLTLQQPWASLLFTPGAKVIETRAWSTDYRGTILIHAAKGQKGIGSTLIGTPPFSKYVTDWDQLPFGKIIGAVTLREIIPTSEICRKILSSQTPVAGFAGHNWEDELQFGDYQGDRLGWVLTNPVKFPGWIDYKGHLGLRNVNPAYLVPEFDRIIQFTQAMENVLGAWQKLKNEQEAIQKRQAPAQGS